MRWFTVKHFKVKDLYLEVSAGRERNAWFQFILDYTWKEDHAGLLFMLSLFTIKFELGLRDIRSWNEENNCWCPTPKERSVYY